MQSLVAARIFDGGVDLIEEGEVVKLALHLEKSGLVEGLAGLDDDLVLDGIGPGVMEAADEDIADEDLVAGRDAEGNVDEVGIAG